MTPRSLTGFEKWPNFHRGAFRPPSGGGSLRRRPPAPSASRRFEPSEAAALFALERCECVRTRSASSEGARGSRLFFRELACLSTVRERLLARVTWEKRKAAAHVLGVCVWKRKTAVIENCANLISASGGSCRGDSERVICELVKPSQLKLVSILPLNLINISERY